MDLGLSQVYSVQTNLAFKSLPPLFNWSAYTQATYLEGSPFFCLFFLLRFVFYYHYVQAFQDYNTTAFPTVTHLIQHKGLPLFFSLFS